MSAYREDGRQQQPSLFDPNQRQPAPFGARFRAGEARFSHNDEYIQSARFAGGFVISLDTRGDLRLFSARTGYCLSTLELPKRGDGDKREYARGFALSPDQQTIVAAGIELTIIDVGTFSIKDTKNIQDRVATASYFSPCGRWLVLHTKIPQKLYSGQIELWKADLSEKLATVPWDDFFKDLTFTPSGERILVAPNLLRAQGVTLFCLPDLKEEAKLQVTKDHLTSLVALDEERFLLGVTRVSDTPGPNLRMCRVEGSWLLWKKLVAEPHTEESFDLIEAMALSPDRTKVAVSRRDGLVSLITIADGRREALVSGQGKPLDWSGEHGLLLSKEKRLFVADPAQIHGEAGHGGPVIALAFTPDGKQFVSIGGYSGAIFWSAETGDFVKQVPKVNGYASSTQGERVRFVVRPNHEIISVNELGVYRTSSDGNKIQALSKINERKDATEATFIVASAIKSDGSLIAILSADGWLSFLNDEGKITARTQLPKSNPPHSAAICFHQEEDRVFVASNQKIVALRLDGSKIDELAVAGVNRLVHNSERGSLWAQVGSTEIREIQLSQRENPRRFETKQEGYFPKLWDEATRNPLPRAFAVHPKGKFLAHANQGKLVIRDLHNEKEFETGWSWLWCLAFSPDGAMLVAGGPDGTLLAWDTSLF